MSWFMSEPSSGCRAQCAAAPPFVTGSALLPGTGRRDDSERCCWARREVLPRGFKQKRLAPLDCCIFLSLLGTREPVNGSVFQILSHS